VDQLDHRPTENRAFRNPAVPPRDQKQHGRAHALAVHGQHVPRDFGREPVGRAEEFPDPGVDLGELLLDGDLKR
jgi:hypothetical protein